MSFRDRLFGATILRDAEDGAGGGGGAGSADGATAGAEAAGAAPWYGTIAHDEIKGVASKFESEKAFLDAMGFEADDGDWRTGLPDDLKATAERFTSPADAVKAAADLRKMQSTSIRIPGKDAKPEEVTAYRKALGVPEKADGYKWPELPQGEALSDADKASREAWSKRFHEAGVSEPQFQSMVTAFREDQARVLQAEIEADKAFAAEQDAKLKAKWPGEEYARNREYANRAAARIWGDQVDAVKALQDKTGRFVLDNALMLEALAKIGRESDEDRNLGAVSDGERQTINDQIGDLRDKAAKARAKGDTQEANRFYRDEMALIGKRDGNKSIVGAGRAA